MKIFTDILAFFLCNLFANDNNHEAPEKRIPNPIITGMDYQGNYYSMQKQPDGTWKSWMDSKKTITKEEFESILEANKKITEG